VVQNLVRQSLSLFVMSKHIVISDGITKTVLSQRNGPDIKKSKTRTIKNTHYRPIYQTVYLTYNQHRLSQCAINRVD